MKFFREWPARHQHAGNFWLHMAGIPMTFVGIYCWCTGRGWLGTALFVGGYALQFAGHALEGNDVGEMIPIKKAFGMKTVAVAPQYQRMSDPPAS